MNKAALLAIFATNAAIFSSILAPLKHRELEGFKKPKVNRKNDEPIYSEVRSQDDDGLRLPAQQPHL